MKKIQSLLFCSLVILTFIGMLSACSSEKENYLSSLPDKSSMVFKLNTAQLVTKSNILNNPMVSGLLMQADQQVPDALKDKFNEIKNDPAAAGIDLQKPLAIAIEMGNIDFNSPKESSQPAVVFVVAVDNVDKFDGLMKDVVESEPSITLSDIEGVKQLHLPEEGLSMAYNDSRIVMAYGENMSAVSLVNQKVEESMLVQPDFADFAANSQDCSLFMDYGWILNTALEAQKSGKAPIAISPQLEEYIKDMSLYGFMNFESGKVVGGMEVYPSEKAKDYIDQFYMKPTSELVGLLPENSYLGFNFAIKNYSDCLKYLGEKERQQIEQLLQEYGLTTEIIDNVHGNILMGIYEDADNALIPGIVLALQCKDHTLFNKVKEMMHITEEGDSFSIPNMGYLVSYVDDVVILSTQGLYDQCLASGNIRSWDKSWEGTTMGKALSKGGLAIDFQAISKNALLKQFSGNKETAVALSVLKQLESFTLQMEDKLETSSELILVDKDKNALEQLIAIGIGAAMAR